MMHGWRLKGGERERKITGDRERERVREMRDTVMMHSFMQIIYVCLSLLISFSLSLFLCFCIGLFIFLFLSLSLSCSHVLFQHWFHSVHFAAIWSSDLSSPNLSSHTAPVSHIFEP